MITEEENKELCHTLMQKSDDELRAIIAEENIYGPELMEVARKELTARAAGKRRQKTAEEIRCEEEEERKSEAERLQKAEAERVRLITEEAARKAITVRRRTKQAVITIGVFLVAVAGLLYWYLNRPEILWEKAKNAKDKETAITYLNRLAQKKNKEWSGKAYFKLFLSSSRDTALLLAAAAREQPDACLFLGDAYKQGNQRDFPADTDKAVRYFKMVEKYGSKSNQYEADCELIEIYIFDPHYRDYQKAAQLISKYYTSNSGYSTDNKRARNYAGILTYMGEGGYKQDMNRAFPLLKDAESGIEAWYLGNVWIRKSLYDSHRMDYCMAEAMNCYSWASGRFVVWEEGKERQILLADFLREYEKANDRSHLYGSDEYYYSGALEETWQNYQNYDSRFHYDGRTKGNVPHGTGVGEWKKTKELFCGIWENGYPKKGIYAFGNGDIYVGTLNRGKFIKGIYTRKDHTKVIY